MLHLVLHWSFAELVSVFISRALPYLRLDTLPCRLGMPEGHKLLWTLCFCLQTRRLLLGLGFLHSYWRHCSDIHLCSLLGASWNSYIQWQSARRNRRRKKPYLPPLTPVGKNTSTWIFICFPLTGQADPFACFYICVIEPHAFQPWTTERVFLLCWAMRIRERIPRKQNVNTWGYF